jgi:Resolvase, N terminal domain
LSATTIAHKVSAEHLARTAYLYVRQSTLRQIKDNTESTERQYALRQRAVQLGWPTEQIVVIDSDQGQSGASSSGREGFQRLRARAWWPSQMTRVVPWLPGRRASAPRARGRAVTRVHLQSC